MTFDPDRKRVLLLEPYFGGSHRAWAEGYARTSQHQVEVLDLPGRFWKWRMHGAAVTLSRRLLASRVQADVILATDMLDLAAFLGLVRRSGFNLPVYLYMHENQLAYPPLPDEPSWSASRRRRAAIRDFHYAFVNYTSALAADRVLWNSAYNRDSFLSALPSFLRQFPDHRELDTVAEIAAKSVHLPLGLDLQALDAARRRAMEHARPRLLWNHRWEHDKDPATFFRAVSLLADAGVDFELVLLGEHFASIPPVFEAARERYGPRIVQFGHVPDRADYAAWLWSSDVVVSTARQEFFGAAVVEAIYCGCRPVLPHALSYPELIPAHLQPQVLYRDFDGLVERLRLALEAARQGPAPPELRAWVAAYDWSVMAPCYDRVLATSAGQAVGSWSERRGQGNNRMPLTDGASL